MLHVRRFVWRDLSAVATVCCGSECCGAVKSEVKGWRELFVDAVR
jgi:hypothetical protein